MATPDTRTAIIAIADDLFYSQGYDHTSFADIANAVGISRGNFYYHFRSKDEILDAVIAARLEATGEMLARWESEAPDPANRIKRFIDIVVDHQADILQHGCPVGSLCTELGKLDHPAHENATALFQLFRRWLRKQFTRITPTDADAHAMQVLAFSQGTAVMAQAFKDMRFVRSEVRRMHDWVDSLAASSSPSSKTPPGKTASGKTATVRARRRTTS